MSGGCQGGQGRGHSGRGRERGGEEGEERREKGGEEGEGGGWGICVAVGSLCHRSGHFCAMTLAGITFPGRPPRVQMWGMWDPAPQGPYLVAEVADLQGVWGAPVGEVQAGVVLAGEDTLLRTSEAVTRDRAGGWAVRTGGAPRAQS